MLLYDYSNSLQIPPPATHAPSQTSPTGLLYCLAVYFCELAKVKQRCLRTSVHMGQSTVRQRDDEGNLLLVRARNRRRVVDSVNRALHQRRIMA